jgi:hypothetical protein
MKLKGRFVFAGCFAAAFAALAVGGPAFSQRIGPGPGRFSPDDAMGFVGFEAGLGGGKTVTGAPFTASFSQQTTQAFADGNRIQRTTTGTLARDSSGRFRRDMTLPAIGDWATSGKTPPHAVLIKDPVAGADYILQPADKTARKLPSPQNGFGKGGPAAQGGPGGPGGPHPQFAQNDVVTTSLGTQTINGVSAQGTRTTRTIPAGAIGNEKPIVITVERWYSPDLQMNVMIKRSDPRTGDNVFQVTNIVRGEPDASLFQVPSDYAIKEGGQRRFARKGPPPPPGD